MTQPLTARWAAGETTFGVWGTLDSAFAAELIDRFGKLPDETDNLLKVIEIKLNCRAAQVVKLDVGPKGALVHFHNDAFPDLEGLIAYVQRLKGTAKLRPDSKLVISRSWPDAPSRVNGALQLSRGLARILSASPS